MTSSIQASNAWRKLAELAENQRNLHLRDLFNADAQRFADFSLAHDGLLLDYSKQRLSRETLAAWCDLWQSADVPGWIARMRAGEHINGSEDRAVLHIALRERSSEARPEVREVLGRMRDFCAAVQGGAWLGASGERITDIVNIGIGGSDLGPRMITQALAAQCQPALRVRYVANLDAADLATTLADLQPQRTLFVVASTVAAPSVTALL